MRSLIRRNVAVAVVVTLFALLAVSCGKGSSSSDDTTQGAFGAVCDLSNSQTPTLLVCIDFLANSSANQTACSMGGSEYNRYHASVGVTADSYIYATTAGATVSCIIGGSNPIVGSCKLSDRIVRYYTTAWTLPTAQTDCTGRMGQFSN